MAGDRIGKLSLAHLRELRLCAEMKGEARPEDFTRVLEILESILEQAHESENDRAIVAEEIVDVMKRCEEQRTEAVDEAKDTERRCDDAVKDIMSSKDDALKDHEEDMRLAVDTANEWRKRAEAAEHAVEEMTAKREAEVDRIIVAPRDMLEKRIARLEEEALAGRKQIADLEKALEIARTVQIRRMKR